MVVYIPLSKTSKKYAGLYEAIVDDEDADLALLNWQVKIFKGKNLFYAGRGVKRPKTRMNDDIRMHRVILQRTLPFPLQSNDFVDHIDGNGLNNQRSNLRLATNAENVRNSKRPERNKTGAKGVCVHKKFPDKFYAQITHNGKKIYLGLFDTLEEAKAAYDTKGKELRGEFFNPG